MSEANPKILTLAQANAALPQVIQVVERLQQLQRAIAGSEELRIQYWHTLEGGFAGRQPVDGLVR